MVIAQITLAAAWVIERPSGWLSLGGPAGADRIDEDAVPGQFRGEQPGERVERGLGHAVRG
jgi:hypothetical protein